MNTPSHLLITAAIVESLPRNRVVKSAALLGAVAPDLPLYLLSVGTYWHLTQNAGWPPRDALEHMFSTLFYFDPVWIALHNLLHAPLVLLSAIAVIWLLHSIWPVDEQERSRSWWSRGSTGLLQSWWGWFFMSCLLHTLIDIPTHHDDGPLILFPVDWFTRFYSPISYWDPNHFGRPFTVFEALLDLFLIAYLGVIFYRRWTRRAKD